MLWSAVPTNPFDALLRAIRKGEHSRCAINRLLDTIDTKCDNLGNQLRPTLHAAVRAHLSDVFQRLWKMVSRDEQAFALATQPFTPRQISIMHLVAYTAEIKILNFLLEQGVSLNEKDNKGVIPLMLAAARGGRDVTKRLLAYSADPYLHDHSGMAALEWAIESKQESVAELLLEWMQNDIEALKNYALAKCRQLTSVGNQEMFHSGELLRLTQTLIYLSFVAESREVLIAENTMGIVKGLLDSGKTCDCVANKLLFVTAALLIQKDGCALNSFLCNGMLDLCVRKINAFWYGQRRVVAMSAAFLLQTALCCGDMLFEQFKLLPADDQLLCAQAMETFVECIRHFPFEQTQLKDQAFILYRHYVSNIRPAVRLLVSWSQPAHHHDASHDAFSVTRQEFAYNCELRPPAYTEDSSQLDVIMMEPHIDDTLSVSESIAREWAEATWLSIFSSPLNHPFSFADCQSTNPEPLADNTKHNLNTTETQFLEWFKARHQAPTTAGKEPLLPEYSRQYLTESQYRTTIESIGDIPIHPESQAKPESSLIQCYLDVLQETNSAITGQTCPNLLYPTQETLQYMSADEMLLRTVVKYRQRHSQLSLPSPTAQLLQQRHLEYYEAESISAAHAMPSIGSQEIKPVCCKRWLKNFALLQSADLSKMTALDDNLRMPEDNEDFVIGRSSFGGKVSLGLAQVDGQRHVLAVRQVERTDKADFCIRRLQDFTRLIDMNNSHLLHYRKTVETERVWYMARQVCDWNLDEYLSVQVLDSRDFMGATLPLFYHLLKGLEFMHGKIPTLFHGNLKPSNLLIDSNGILRLVDFGFGKLCALPHQYSGPCIIADTGRFHPICWKPPEFYCVSTTYNGRSDVHSAAMLAYYMLSAGSKHAFVTEVNMNAKQLQQSVTSGQFMLNSNLPHEAKCLLSSMLAARMDERPDASTVLEHPLFWPIAKRSAFLLAAATRITHGTAMDAEIRNGVQLRLSHEPDIGAHWMHKLPQHLHDQCDAALAESPLNLLVCINNCYQRRIQLQNSNKSADPAYFMDIYPTLLMHIYTISTELHWAQAHFPSNNLCAFAEK